jgi:hypothetical protein
MDLANSAPPSPAAAIGPPIRLGEPGPPARQEPSRVPRDDPSSSSVEPRAMAMGGGRSARPGPPPFSAGPDLPRPRANAILAFVILRHRSTSTAQPARNGRPAADLSATARRGPAAQTSPGCSPTRVCRRHGLRPVDTGVSRQSRRWLRRPAAATSRPYGQPAVCRSADRRPPLQVAASTGGHPIRRASLTGTRNARSTSVMAYDRISPHEATATGLAPAGLENTMASSKMPLVFKAR